MRGSTSSVDGAFMVAKWFTKEQLRLETWPGSLCCIPGYSASLYPGVRMRTTKFNAVGNPAMD